MAILAPARPRPRARALPQTIWRRKPGPTPTKGACDLDFHPGQNWAWHSPARFTFIISGSQGGKTSFGPWWLVDQVEKFGSGDYLAITASYDLFKLKMLPELRLVFENLLRIGRYWAGSKIIELRDPDTQTFWAKKADDSMWGRIILRSAQSSGGLESATALAAWLDECGQDGFTLEDWEAIQRRLALNEGPALGTTTPYNTGWLKREVYDRWRAGDKTFKVIQFPSVLNPAFPRREFERLRATMQSWRFKMFYQGLLVRPAGLIYDCFTDEHIVDPFPVPKAWRRVVGVDFGGANQGAVYLALEAETSIWYAYAETLEGGKTTAEYARTVIDMLTGCPEYQVVGGAPSESQQRRDWAAAGVWVGAPDVPEVEPGIDRVTEIIKTGRFRVFRTCKGLLDEFGSYRRKLDDEDEPTDLILDKRKYHRLDCLRYAASRLRRRVGFG